MNDRFLPLAMPQTTSRWPMNQLVYQRGYALMIQLYIQLGPPLLHDTVSPSITMLPQSWSMPPLLLPQEQLAELERRLRWWLWQAGGGGAEEGEP